MRAAVPAALTAIATFLLCVLAPLRELSGDSTPGRLGGTVLRCAGDFDLAHIDWIRAETDQDRVFYYMQRDQAGAHSSVFGPAPAVLVAIALLDFGEGDTIADTTLRTRERIAAALLLALATALLVIAARARRSGRDAVIAGAACALSFAGAASLGQGMWQATTALPALTGALATLAWRDRHPRLAIATPALLLLAVMLRPTIAPLALGLGITWALEVRDKRTWIIAASAALLVVSPLIVWNAIHLWSPLPIGQWKANARDTEHVFTVTGAATGIAGLLVSPARGLVWFAPLAVAGIVIALRNRAYRAIAIGLLVQLVAMAAFFKWHGGQAFGPRLLAEATWVAIWLALGTELALRRAIAIPAGAITVAIGLIGLLRFSPAQWEMRRRPEAHPSGFWAIADSPIPAALTAADVPDAFTAAPALSCERGELRSTR
ncbi:MAG TPA: hypothetical protein VIV11_02765 [Kofleriaceae bacterium]